MVIHLVEITATFYFNITFENSVFTVTMVMIKFVTFQVGFPTKWQAKSNVCINKMI